MFDVKGVRNLWIADAPNFSARQVTHYDSDDGLPVASLRITADGRTLSSQQWLERQLNDPYVQRAKARGIPLGRVGEAHEAGDVIAFLASERASYLTGIAINIDGGTSAVV